MPLYRNRLQQWQGDTSQPYPNNFIWKSKEFLFPIEITFNCARVLADVGDRQDYYDAIIDYKLAIERNNQRISALAVGGSIGEDEIGLLTLNGDNLEVVESVPDYSGDFNLTVNFYVDETLIHTEEVYSNNPFRIKGGIKGRKFEIEIIGNVVVKRFDMATSMEELKQ